MVFRPIVGWITVMSRQPPFQKDENAPKNQFHAVVLSGSMFPTPAALLDNYSGVFLKDMQEAEAKKFAREFARRGNEPQPNALGVGQA